MPSLELSKLQAVTGPRALSDTDRLSAQPSSSANAKHDGVNVVSNGSNGISIEISSTLNTSKPPIDNDRVSEIRSALRDGTYPLVPAEISDAIIAAQMSFEIER